MRYEYEISNNEQKLFSSFGFGDIADRVPVVTLYRLCVEKAFIENMKGDNVDILRRCAKAMRDTSMYRMTPEWEALFDLS